MNWKRYFRYFGSLVICAIFVLVFFSRYLISSDAPGWMRVVGVEIQAACRDAGTQWMVVVCLVSYFVVFLFLEKRSKVQGSSCKPESESEAQSAKTPSSKRHHSISYLLTPISSPVFWLLAFVTLVLIRYAFDYPNAARSLQVVVLLTGIVVGKGVALWARSFGSGVLGLGFEGKQPTPINREMESNDSLDSHAIQPQTPDARPRTLLLILVVLLACAALYQPERGMEFQYRGQRRWTGVWDNPNTYGVLMGTGLTLALGLLGSRGLGLGSGGKRPTSNVQHSTSNEVGRVTPCAPGMGGAEPSTFNFQHATTPKLSCSSYISRLKRILPIVILLTAAGVCAYGLIKSYSRGAWLGTAVGIGYLTWRFMECGGMTPPWGTRHVASGKSCTKSQQSKSWILPSSILIVSILIISFWQFRHTESPLLRRVFSVGNPNDFSWRNRVTAWQGAGRMMWDKPIMGFGWGKAEEIYSKEYRAARLEESAAVQLNDYLMIGISAGVPALACFVAYLWLALRRGRVGRGSPLPAELVVDTDGAHGVTRPTINHQQKIPNPDGTTPHPGPLHERGEEGAELSTINNQLSTTAAAGVGVLLIGFWFDGGLFKLPTCVVFWVLLELARGEVLTTKYTKHTKSGYGNFWSFFRVVRVFRGSNESCPEFDSSRRRLQVGLRWLSGIVALFAIGLTVLHLGTPQLAVSDRTLNIARKFIVPPKEKADFEYLAAKPIWSGQPLKTLLQHAHLANYNRTLVNWNLDDQLYREFVLSPEIGGDEFSTPNKVGRGSPLPAALATETDGAHGVARPTSHAQPSTINHPLSTNPNWRRPLWEYFYPRIRKESSLEAAAEIVVRNLNETFRRQGSLAIYRSNETNNPLSRSRDGVTTLSPSDGERDGVRGTTPHVVAYKSVSEIWQQQTAGDAEFERIYVAALRSAGIPARLSASGQVEFWNGAEWKPAPRPEARPKVD